MELPDDLKSIFDLVEINKTYYIDNLKKIVAIESVSAWPKKREEIVKVTKWFEKKLTNLGAIVELCDVGYQEGSGDEPLPLPPVLLGTLETDPEKKTVCIYGHLDVQPASKEEGWETEPFVLTEKEEKLFGRGASDDKGPVLCWLHALEAYMILNIPFPVNIKFVLEGMEETGSDGLYELLYSRKDSFFKDIDYVCISDNYWLGKNKPCITYGLRGLCYFNIEVKCAKKDLHSGVFGGSVQEALPDLIYLLNTLVDRDGQILVKGLSDDVAPVSDEEMALYENIEFDVGDFCSEIGAEKLSWNNHKFLILMHRWRYPSLSIHGIEGAFSEPGAKTVIPGKVIGKFSVRIVPNQTMQKVERCVVDYVTEQWKLRNSVNSMKVFMTHGGMHWVSDPNHPHYMAAKKATQYVYNTIPDMIREGGTIPVTLTLQDLTGKNVLLLPIGASDDGAHSQNEKIDVRNYIQGTKLLAAYLYEVAQLKQLELND